MAAHMDFFRRLGSGAKFDFKRFKRDAERFQIIKPTETVSHENAASTLDLFGTRSKATSSVGIKKAQCNTSQDDKPSKQVVNKRRRPDDDDAKVTGKKRKQLEQVKHTDSKHKRKGGSNGNSENSKHNRKGGSDDDSENGSRDDANTSSDSDDDQEHDTSESDDDDEDTADVTVGQSDVTLMTSFGGKKEGSDDEDATLKNQDDERQQTLKSLRKHHRIHVLGSDVPDPIGTFQAMQQEYRLHTDVVENIHRAGYVSPTAIQMQAVPVMIHRRELLACAPTGSGKTASFILPVLHHLKEPRNQGFRAVVVSPSRELAQQTYREFVRLADGRGFRIHTIDNTAKAAKKYGPQSAGKFDILVTTPNRLVYMLNQDPPTIKLNNVEWLIVDESDKLFEGGKSGFREQLATIYQACDSNQVRRAMFSATFTYEVEQWCKLNLDNVVMVTVGQKNAATETVKQDLMFVGDEYGKLLAIRDIFKKGFLPPVLIFVQSKERAKELFHELIYDGYNVDVIHADKSQVQRDNVVRSFRAGKIWVLIATELMGRGIDFKGVNLVINYDFPTSAISYIHRIGRTGRAGRKGSAVTFFTEDDIAQLRTIANVMRNAGCPVPEYMLHLKKVSKKRKKKLAERAPKRKTIRTLPGATTKLEKAQKKKLMMKGKGHQIKDQSGTLSKKGKEKTQNKHVRNQAPKDANIQSQPQQADDDGWVTVGPSHNTEESQPKRTKKSKKFGKKTKDKNGEKNKKRTMKKNTTVKSPAMKGKKKLKKKAHKK